MLSAFHMLGVYNFNPGPRLPVFPQDRHGVNLGGGPEIIWSGSSSECSALDRPLGGFSVITTYLTPQSLRAGDTKIFFTASTKKTGGITGT